MSRGIKLDPWLVDDESIKKHLAEIEYKYVACFTNVNNIRTMINSIKREINKGWDKKTLSIALEEQENNLQTNLTAIRLHRRNITFLKDNLWT